MRLIVRFTVLASVVLVMMGVAVSGGTSVAAQSASNGFTNVPDSYTAYVGVPFSLPAPGVLSNDDISACSGGFVHDGYFVPRQFDIGNDGSISFTPAVTGTLTSDYHYDCSSLNGGGFAYNNTVGVTITVLASADPPVLTVPGTITVEATSASGAAVTFSTSATSANSPAPTIACSTSAGTVVSGSTFAIGSTLVTCTATDANGKTDTESFTIIVEDTTAPVLTVPANITTEATSGAGAVVTYVATANDIVNGSVTPVCTPVSGSTFPIGTTTVSCVATDAAGNSSAAQTFTITVGDTTGPVITWVGGPQPGKTYTQANLPAEPTCTATDTSSPVTQCRVYGYSTAPGTYTLTARARDTEGNSTISTRTYTVTASAPTATPRPATATPRPATATPRPATATPTRPARPTVTPVAPTATTAAPASTSVPPTVQSTVPPTPAPTRPPRQ